MVISDGVKEVESLDDYGEIRAWAAVDSIASWVLSTCDLKTKKGDLTTRRDLMMGGLMRMKKDEVADWVVVAFESALWMKTTVDGQVGAAELTGDHHQAGWMTGVTDLIDWTLVPSVLNLLVATTLRISKLGLVVVRCWHLQA